VGEERDVNEFFKPRVGLIDKKIKINTEKMVVRRYKRKRKLMAT
jgi:hypothetical protein